MPNPSKTLVSTQTLTYSRKQLLAAHVVEGPLDMQGTTSFTNHGAHFLTNNKIIKRPELSPHKKFSNRIHTSTIFRVSKRKPE